PGCAPPHRCRRRRRSRPESLLVCRDIARAARSLARSLAPSRDRRRLQDQATEWPSVMRAPTLPWSISSWLPPPEKRNSRAIRKRRGLLDSSVAAYWACRLSSARSASLRNVIATTLLERG